MKESPHQGQQVVHAIVHSQLIINHSPLTILKAARELLMVNVEL